MNYEIHQTVTGSAIQQADNSP